jgi:uncharacterized membrane protein
MKRIALALIAALMVCGSMFAQSTKYSFTDTYYPDDPFIQLLGINDSGVIAGYHGSAINQGFTLNMHEFSLEDYPNSMQTQVIGINNASPVETVGFYIDQRGGNHGFTHQGSTYKRVDFPGTTFNQLLGVNDLGIVAGYYQDSLGNFHPYIAFPPENAFEELHLKGTKSAQATGINDSGVVVGFYLDSMGVSHGWQLQGDTFFALNFPASTSTAALGINNGNVIVGDYTDQENKMHGFTYSNGVWTSVDDPNGIGITLVNGINDSGTLVGFYTISTTVNTAFVAVPQE